MNIRKSRNHLSLLYPGPFNRKDFKRLRLDPPRTRKGRWLFHVLLFTLCFYCLHLAYPREVTAASKCFYGIPGSNPGKQVSREYSPSILQTLTAWNQERKSKKSVRPVYLVKVKGKTPFHSPKRQGIF